MRLDLFLIKKFNLPSRTKAQDLIKNQLVLVNNNIVNSAHFNVSNNDNVKVIENNHYVSRGALKLLTAIEKFKINFLNKVVVDFGSSTGGFTQVALENGAKKIYCIDVGKNQLDKNLKTNPKIITYEETNLKNLTPLNFQDKIDVVVADLSFISLTVLLGKINELFYYPLKLICLIKPQFELSNETIKKTKGIISSNKYQKQAIDKVVNFAKQNNYVINDITPSKIVGKKGNQEFLIYMDKK